MVPIHAGGSGDQWLFKVMAGLSAPVAGGAAGGAAGGS
jgi:hypothetical protein